jgi:DNA-directed RNA polymerase specialized sigma24 family protein
MERLEALGKLPGIYAEALRLRGAGLRTGAIAERLGLEVEAVPTVIRLAETKLERLLGSEDGPETGRLG